MNPPNASAVQAQHSPGPWKILPCPVHAGKHPFHDARWIATADAVVEKSPHVPDDWALESGSLICQMRDGPEANARLIAAAPALLSTLRGLATHFLNIDHDCNRTPEGLAMRDAVWAVISKAEGRA